MSIEIKKVGNETAVELTGRDHLVGEYSIAMQLFRALQSASRHKNVEVTLTGPSLTVALNAVSRDLDRMLEGLKEHADKDLVF